MAVCSEIHTKHINILCGQNVEFVSVKPSGTHSDHCAYIQNKDEWVFSIYVYGSSQGAVILNKADSYSACRVISIRVYKNPTQIATLSPVHAQYYHILFLSIQSNIALLSMPIRSLNAIVAQPKNCPFGVNIMIELKNVTTTSDKFAIQRTVHRDIFL